ncbi:MAG: ABC transporter permease [Methanosarcinaceae archaeon]|nr:ABC transporter permease [Methanosarcinaceae archaeon]MDF1533554.1 ABC transporter permease [Methanosarcinaceae archaeon]
MGIAMLKLQRLKNIRGIDPLMLLFYILSLSLLLFVFVTLANMIVGQVLTDFAGLVETAASKPVIKSIFLSLYAGFIATMISFLLGVPTAYILARKNFVGKRFVESMLDVPVVVPHTVAGIALLTVFGANGLLGAPLEPYIQFRDAMPGIIVAMLFVSAPYLTNSAREGFKSVDPKLENAARSLGAPLWKAFAFVTLPLASRHLLIGSIMCWARAISEFGAVVMIAYYPMIGPTLIYDRFLSQGLSASRPIAVLLILVTLTIFIAMRILSAGWRVYDKDQ